MAEFTSLRNIDTEMAKKLASEGIDSPVWRLWGLGRLLPG